MILQSWTEDATIKTVAQWRHDSATLARLRPVLERLRELPDQPCRLGDIPYSCAREFNNRLCTPCAVRDIRQALFGAEGVTDGTQ